MNKKQQGGDHPKLVYGEFEGLCEVEMPCSDARMPNLFGFCSNVLYNKSSGVVTQDKSINNNVRKFYCLFPIATALLSQLN